VRRKKLKPEDCENSAPEGQAVGDSEWEWEWKEKLVLWVFQCRCCSSCSCCCFFGFNAGDGSCFHRNGIVVVFIVVLGHLRRSEKRDLVELLSDILQLDSGASSGGFMLMGGIIGRSALLGTSTRVVSSSQEFVVLLNVGIIPATESVSGIIL
jgi:hypothetical protein